MGRNQKVWGLANTGTKFHAFVQDWADKDGVVSQNFKRAMCRKTIARSADMIGAGIDDVKSQASLCDQCVKLFVAMVARAEASMQPVNPYDQVCEGVVTAEGAARVAEANELNERTIDAAMPTRPDMNAVTEAPDSPAVLDALHAEALKEDGRRTAEAHGVVPGARFIPRRGTRNNPERVITVMRLNHTPYGFGVTYSIWEPGYQGSPGDWGSTASLRLFIRQYEPEATAERDGVTEAIRTLRKAPYPAIVQAMGVLERAGIFAEASAAPLRPTRWYYTVLLRTPSGPHRARLAGFVNATSEESARQAVHADWADKLQAGEYLDYLQVEEA